MMSVGPKIGIAPQAGATGPGAVGGAAGGEGDLFLQMLAGLGKALTVVDGADEASGAPAQAETEENLTIKTFQKLLDANPGETEPDGAPVEGELFTSEQDESESVGSAVILSSPMIALAPPPHSSPLAATPATRQPQATAEMAALPEASANIPGQAVAAEAKGLLATTGEAAKRSLVLRPGLDKAAASAQPDADPAAATMKAVAAKLPEVERAPIIDVAAAPDAAPSAPAPGPALARVLSTLASPAAGAVAEAASASGPAPAAEALDPSVEQQLDLAHEGEWLDRLARDIARSSGNEGTLRFRLNPENLGALKVELTQGHDGASVRLTTETEAARAIMADAQPRLVAEARAQGVRIAEAHVDLGAGGHSAAQDQRRQGGDQPQGFVRTAGTGTAFDDDVPRQAANTSERYA